MARNQDNPDLGDYMGSYFGGGGGSPRVTQDDPTAATGGSPSSTGGASQSQVAGWYQQYLGRPGSATEWDPWANGPYNASQVEDYIKNSPEAQAYAKQQAMPAPAAPAASAPPDTGGGGGGGYSAPPPAQRQYGSDAYNLMNQLALRRIGSLEQPTSFPILDKYMAMLQQNEADAKQRAQLFAGQLGTRIGELQQPLLNQQQNQLIRTQAEDNLNRQRDAALQNMRNQAYTRGFEPTTGLIAGNERSINEQYTNAQSNIEAKLAANAISTDEARRNEATQLQGLVQQALAGGDVTALQNEAQRADLENQQYNLGQQRAREQLTTANIPVDLENMGLSNALGVAGGLGGGNPLGSLMQILPMLGQQQQLQLQQRQNQLGGWGSLLGGILGGGLFG